jgi:dihydrofolate reductase
MKKIILFNMVTLDGFFEGPDKEIDWHNVDEEFNDFAIDQLDEASVLIFGRITYELMAGYWPTSDALKNDPAVAEKMNSLPKVVFSNMLVRADWNNTVLKKGNIFETINDLKETHDKDIFIFGSGNLAMTLTNLNLIDEYRLMLNPVLLGRGNPLFSSLAERLKLRLINSRVFRSGNVLLCYEPVRE